MIRFQAGVFMCLFCPGLAQSAQAETILPWSDSFTGTAPAKEWQTDVSSGNDIAVRDGVLEIRAAENTFAHIQRPLGVDHVRASARIQAGGGVSWASSLFLYWQPGDWCQMGVIPRGDGSFYVCVTTEGRRSEQDLGRCRYADFQHVAIELGQNCIRFMASADGRNWRNELFVERPARLMGPPALLIVGKGFGLDAGSADLNSDYGVRGAVGVSRVDDVAVVPTDPARMRIMGDEIRERERVMRDPLGSRILESGREPSYEAVADVLPPLLKPREAVGAKDGRYEIGVEYDGTLQFDTGVDNWQSNGPSAWFEVGEPPVRFGSSGCAKRLLEGHLPIVIGRFEHDGLAFEQTVMGWSEGMDPDAPLWGYVRLEVTNPAAAERLTRVAFKSRPEAVSTLAPMTLRLPAGGKAEICLRAASPAKDGGVALMDAAEFSTRLDEVVACWKKTLNAGLRVSVPESRINDAWRAWLAYNFIDVDKIGEVYEPHDGAGFYEAVFGYSEVLYGHALDLWGFHDDARRYLESMFTFMKPDGLFAINYGLPDHGGLLLALAEHYRLTDDKEWLRKVSPRMIQMCNWAIARRGEITKAGADRSSVTYGLIKYRPYCDYETETYNYYANAYCCIGLEQTADVLARIGMAGEAARIGAEAAAYRKDILASMDAAVIERDGTHLLPMEPDTHRLLKDSGYECGDYYSLVASMLLECEFLPAADPRARLVTSGLENRRGLILGMCEFNQGVDHAYTYGYWLNCLRRDEVNRVLLGFYGTLAYGMGRDTYCGVEVTQIATGEPTPTMPHLYSGTQQLRLLRMMLLQEEGDELIVGRALPAAWLVPGQRVEINAAPTYFGPVSVVIESAKQGGQIDVSIDPPTRRPPKAIRLRLPDASGRAITAATLDGRELATFGGNSVTVTPTGRRMRITARR